MWTEVTQLIVAFHKVAMRRKVSVAFGRGVTYTVGWDGDCSTHLPSILQFVFAVWNNMCWRISGVGVDI